MQPQNPIQINNGTPTRNAQYRSAGGKKVAYLQSQWVFRRTNTDAARLRDHFKKFLDNNDRLLVVCLNNTDWAGLNLMNKISQI